MSERLVKVLRERMAAKRLNPYRLSKMAGLGADAVRDILRGRVVNPSAAHLQALADVLDCTVADFFGSPSDHADADIVTAPTDVGESELRASTVRSYSLPRAEEPAASIETTAHGRVDLNIKANVSMGVAAQILALIEGEKP